VYFLRFVLPLACLISTVSFAADAPVVIKKVTVAPISPVAGPEMFKEYCATCHGVDAKGRGPAYSALKVPPPDLTVLSRNNHGKFPDHHVYAAIRGDANLPSHGSKDMPVWGVVFHEMGGTGVDAQVAVRMRNLILYIESLQQK
jgi:mono/diheme cytochrome c family protein